MNFDLELEHRMIRDLVARFVQDELIPLEAAVMAREADGQRFGLLDEERAHLDERSRQLGLWGLDAPLDAGGSDLPAVAMVGINEAIGTTVTPYILPPDSPNLRMLCDVADDAQRARYLEPYARGITRAAMAISEPGAGSDPGALSTTAVRDGDNWVLNGRKIWISHAPEADWTIVMALTDRSKGKRGGMSAFIVDRGTPGFIIERRIPMIGGLSTYEIVLDDCRIPAAQLLGQEGAGFAPMQARLANRRLEMAAWCIGRAERAVAMLCDHAKQRKTFGVPLAERQAVQWWVADALTQIHACRLMTYEAAARVDAGQDARTQISMVKVFATEMASSVIDHAMQTLGAMGMTKEMPLQQMASEARLMRIFEGPTEVHRWVIARSAL